MQMRRGIAVFSRREDVVDQTHSDHCIIKRHSAAVATYCLDHALRLAPESGLEVRIPSVRIDRVELALAGILVGRLLQRTQFPASARCVDRARPRARPIPDSFVEPDVTAREPYLGKH